jgi:COP9 signalosome complex subunit 6
MLKSRLHIILDYLYSQPPSYLTDASIPVATDGVLDQKILRSIYALTAQVNLAAPSDASGISLESARTQTNAELIGLLSSLTRSMADIKTLGIRQSMAETQRMSNDFPPIGGMFSQDVLGRDFRERDFAGPEFTARDFATQD